MDNVSREETIAPAGYFAAELRRCQTLASQFAKAMRLGLPASIRGELTRAPTRWVLGQGSKCPRPWRLSESCGSMCAADPLGFRLHPNTGR
jgi:hypothetical protein